jgi:hypothetical protein
VTRAALVVVLVTSMRAVVVALAVGTACGAPPLKPVSNTSEAYVMPGDVAGRVVDSSTDTGLDGVVVVISVPPHDELSDITGSRGDFRISDVPAGQYFVTAYFGDKTDRRRVVVPSEAAVRLVLTIASSPPYGPIP